MRLGLRSRHKRAQWVSTLVTGVLSCLLALAASATLAGFTISRAVAAPLVGRTSAAALDDCAGPVTGRHIYDCAHLLTPAEIANLETQAAAVDKAGAPTVVYLQARATTADQALQDAIDLMNRWNVESKSGAHDGFVMLFDLQPGNLRHGEVALYAGAKHYQHGNLPQSELDRIRTDVMTPLLASGETAAGIAAGLQMVAHDLQYGPPPPPPYQTGAANFGRLPFNLLGALFAGVVGWLFVRSRRQAPISGEGGAVGLGALAAPGDLSPALAGALIKGRVNDDQMEATILDFARRGLLTIVPVEQNKVQVHLVGDGNGLTGYEQQVWNDLMAHGTSGVGGHTLSTTDLTEVRQNWAWAKSLLRRDLIERGWYNPDAAAARRRPLYLAGVVGVVGIAAALIVMALAQEAWAAIGLVIFLAASITAFGRGHAIPDTTVEGELAAAPWRGYVESVTAQTYEPNLDTDLPYIVGLGILGQLAPRLKAASEQGYSPTWFKAPAAKGGRTNDHPQYATGFYPYWIAFHSGMTPTSSGGSASGGYSGGGAAGGGGGSAGAF